MDLNNICTFRAKIENLDNKFVKESEDNMKGSVSLRKDGRFQGRFYFQGKRYYVYGRSKTSCWDNLRKKRKELQASFTEVDKISKTMYLNTWFDYWVNNFKIQQVKESTFLKTIEVYDRYIRNTIGKLRINNINYMKIQEFINSLDAYSAKLKTIQIFKPCFELLVKENYIVKDPMNLIVIPKKNRGEPIIKDDESQIITSKTEQKLFDSFKNKKSLYYALKLILYTGLRRGECIGLIWKNVDLVNDQIYVEQQWNTTTNSLTDLKSNAAYRYIPLLPEAREILIELNKRPHKTDDFVFTGIKKITTRCNEISTELDINFTPHTLRHTFASRLYAAGVDQIIIQKILGHEDVDTTLNNYVHIIKVEDKELIQKIRDFLISKKLIIVYN